MPERISLTKAVIDALPLPAQGKRKYYHDSKIRGLTICVTWTGLRTWYVQRWAAGSSQRVRLGEYPTMTIEQARRDAERENAKIAAGADPSAEARARRAEWTFGEAFAWYIEHHSKPRKRSWERDEERFRNHLGILAPVPITKVTKAQVRELHAAIGKGAGPYAANRTLALISVVFNKLAADDIFAGANPAASVEPFREVSRDRRLNPAEVRALFKALDDEPNDAIRDYIWMSLYTGARKSNLLAMRWDEVDLESGTWRIPLTKNGMAQVVPLGTGEAEILKRRQAGQQAENLRRADAGESPIPWVFPGRGDGEQGHLAKPEHGWERVLKRAKLTNLRLHDLRRTLGSWMVDTGASLAIVGKTLGHQSHEATAVYARLALDPVREAKAKAIDAMKASLVAPDGQ